MKSIIAMFAVVLGSAAAQACPNLAGNYVCSAFGGLFQIEVPVSQSENKGVTTYIIDGAPMIADGQPHLAKTLPRLLAQHVRDVTYRAQCNGQNLNFQGNGKMVKTNEPGTVNGVLTKTGPTSATIDVTMKSPSSTRNVNAVCEHESSFWMYNVEPLEMPEQF